MHKLWRLKANYSPLGSTVQVRRTLQSNHIVEREFKREATFYIWQSNLSLLPGGLTASHEPGLLRSDCRSYNPRETKFILEEILCQSEPPFTIVLSRSATA